MSNWADTDTHLSFDDLVEWLGEAAAIGLVMLHGSQRLYCPRTPPDHLKLMIGEEACQKLCDRYAGDYIIVPSRYAGATSLVTSAVKRRLACGESPSRVAALYGMSIKRVKAIRKTVSSP